MPTNKVFIPHFSIFQFLDQLLSSILLQVVSVCDMKSTLPHSVVDSMGAVLMIPLQDIENNDRWSWWSLISLIFESFHPSIRLSCVIVTSHHRLHIASFWISIKTFLCFMCVHGFLFRPWLETTLSLFLSSFDFQIFSSL